jgi:hypothetical protein
MDKFKFSTKHVAINKANAQMVAVVGIASFITIFCLVASKTIFSQYEYQSRVIGQSRTADNQLKTNITVYKQLALSYEEFDSQNPNVLGAQVTGTGNDNAQVILDALPGQYDFPGLISTVENILHLDNMQVSAVTGTDLGSPSVTAGSSPQAVAMPFGFSVTQATYGSAQTLLQTFQDSIRPMPIDNMTVTAGNTGLTLTVNAHSYYQPSRTLGITTETVN